MEILIYLVTNENSDNYQLKIQIKNRWTIVGLQSTLRTRIRYTLVVDPFYRGHFKCSGLFRTPEVQCEV